MNLTGFELLFWVVTVASGLLAVLAAARREFAASATALAVLALAIAVAANTIA